MSGPKVYEHDKGGFINLEVGGGSYNAKHQTPNIGYGDG